MPNTFSQSSFHSRCDELARTDAQLAAILRTHGYPPMWNRPNTFETLVHFILEQQVSLAAALAALNKLRERVKEVTPATILALSDEEMKACYFSRQKMGYVRSLAGSLADGHLRLDAFVAMPNEEVRSRTHRDQLLPVIDRWRPNRTIATMLLWHYYLSTPARGRGDDRS
ncbi:MAG TPA: hypothetical protein VMH27_02270 [Puia sp.]|nr:hypothetical protein [Puia sp.]